jgi:hypothetical protein
MICSTMDSYSSTTPSCHVDVKSHIFSNVRALAPVTPAPPQELPIDFKPENYDIICGKGKSFFNHIGNRRFRVTIELYLPQYQAAQTKSGKSAIVNNVVNLIRSSTSSGAGGFIRFDKKTNRWMELGDAGSREKVGQAIRDALTQRDPSKKRARKILRQQQKKINEEMLLSDHHPPPSLFAQMAYGSHVFNESTFSSSAYLSKSSAEFEENSFPNELIRMNLPTAADILPDLSDFGVDDEDAIAPELVTSSIFAL